MADTPHHGERLRRRCRKVSGAHGLDGWRQAELDVFLASWWEVAAETFQLTEETGEWPDGLARAIVALIPKEGGGPTPEQQRPITILFVWYRAWAGIRYDDLKNWQEQWSEVCMIKCLVEYKMVRQCKPH